MNNEEKLKLEKEIYNDYNDIKQNIKILNTIKNIINKELTSIEFKFEDQPPYKFIDIIGKSSMIKIKDTIIDCLKNTLNPNFNKQLDELIILAKNIEIKKDILYKYNIMNERLKILDQSIYEIESDSATNYNEIHEICIGHHAIKPSDINFRKKLFIVIKNEYIEERDKLKKEIENLKI